MQPSDAAKRCSQLNDCLCSWLTACRRLVIAVAARASSVMPSPQVIFSREFLMEVKIGEKQVKYIVETARRGRVQGHRAELFAVR